MRLARLAFLAAAPLAACAAPALSADAARVISDAELVAYAAKPFDKAAMMGRQVTLGLHHGVAVVADFPCSDLCPDYTVRIIHYAVEPGPACDRAGGIVEMRAVPVSIAVMQKPFCVPVALKGKG